MVFSLYRTFAWLVQLFFKAFLFKMIQEDDDMVGAPELSLPELIRNYARHIEAVEGII